jgi:PT repeat
MKFWRGEDLQKVTTFKMAQSSTRGQVIGTALLQLLLIIGDSTLAQTTDNIFTHQIETAPEANIFSLSAETTLDTNGIHKLYSADTTKSPRYDWNSNWSGSSRTLTTSYTSDPQDPLTFYLGTSTGGITIGQDRLVFRPTAPRFYINKLAGSPGFENVEFTAYANYVASGGEVNLAGFTMAVRSDHFHFSTGPSANPCNAVAYYAKIWEGTGSTRGGQVSFSKEYYHEGSTTVFSPAVFAPAFSTFPRNQWIGMKLVAYTIPGTQNVQLELWLDLTDGLNGGVWNLVHSYVDQPGQWRSPGTVPAACPVQNGDTVLGGRTSCALRTDGGEVHWKKASARHIVTTRTTPRPTARPTSKPTKRPTAKPKSKPTKRPTAKPTSKPTKRPTTKPTLRPAAANLTPKPTNRPTRKPTRKPTLRPVTVASCFPAKTVCTAGSQCCSKKCTLNKKTRISACS